MSMLHRFPLPRLFLDCKIAVLQLLALGVDIAMQQRIAMQQKSGSDDIYIGHGILDVTPYMDPEAEPRRGKDPKKTYSHLLQVRGLYLLVVVGTAAVHALLTNLAYLRFTGSKICFFG
jgi:hypothetical protein